MRVVVAHGRAGERRRFRRVLAEAGHDVAEGDRVDSALTRCLEWQPDIAVVDEAAGDGLVERIKATRRRSTPPSCSSRRPNRPVERASEALQRGVQDILVEPVHNAELLTIAIVDIDHFKAVNDRHGHAEGDRVLAGVAHAMREHLRAEDQIGRLGGEEFLVLLPETDARAANRAAEKMRANVAASGVTISIGWTAWEGEDADELLRRADDALYAAKAHGRNCVKGAPATLPRRR